MLLVQRIEPIAQPEQVITTERSYVYSNAISVFISVY